MKPLLFVAVAAMLAQQSFVTMSSHSVPVAAPDIARRLSLDPAQLGLFTTLAFSVSMFASMLSGPHIRRHGGLRVSQTTLLFAGLGLMLAGLGHPLAFLPAAALIGVAVGASTPASSQILARHAPPQSAPLIFSIKQTGVPAGGALAGLAVPWLGARYGWDGALLVLGAAAVGLAVALQPLRARFDIERRPGGRAGSVDTLRLMATVLRDRAYRDLALAAFAYAGLQMAFAAYCVAFLVLDLGMDQAQAGRIFAASQLAAMVARIGWGAVAERLLESVPLLGLLGLAMTAATAFFAFAADSLPLLAAILVGATAVAWNGVFLAAIVRRSGVGGAGEMTGGVLAFSFLGLVAGPGLFGLVLVHTDDYRLALILIALPSLLVGGALLAGARRG